MFAEKLTLIVENTERLDAHSKATATFDIHGGMVGSANDCEWVLRDRGLSVADYQIRVFCTDGNFAIEVLASDGLFVNKSNRPAKRGETLLVRDGDNWTIGDFEVGAFVSHAQDGSISNGKKWQNRFLSMENLVPGILSSDSREWQEQTEEMLLQDGPVIQGDRRLKFLDQSKKKEEIDPVLLIDENQKEVSSKLGTDPLKALNEVQDSKFTIDDSDLAKDLNLVPEMGSGIKPVLDPIPGHEHFVFPTHRRSHSVMNKRSQNSSGKDEELDNYLTELVDGSKSAKAARISEKSGGDLMEQDSWINHEEPDGEGVLDHIILRPLLNSMGLTAAELTGPQADRLAAEVGESVRAAVEGLIALHRRRHNDRAALNETHLHPVEDNPLRLESDPDIAINEMFLNQNPVHLKANIAIEEGLKQAVYHEEASEIAVTAALQSILVALEPARLSNRFSRYRGHAPRVGDMDSWHWQMYQHYYKELSSDRQGGLRRMFREVFQQVYDREMRSRSIEE